MVSQRILGYCEEKNVEVSVNFLCLNSVLFFSLLLHFFLCVCKYLQM